MLLADALRLARGRYGLTRGGARDSELISRGLKLSPRMRAYNAQRRDRRTTAIVGTLRSMGPMTTGQIRRLLGVCATSAWFWTRDLEARGLIRRVDPTAKKPTWQLVDGPKEAS